MNMPALHVIFTVYIDPQGEPWIKWAKDTPDEWKMMLRASFGSMAKEVPDDYNIPSN